MRRWVVPLALGVALAPFAGAGCGTSAVGVQACQEIESARCQRAASECSSVIQLTPPYYTSGSAVDACVRFYDTACLHGLEVSTWTPEDVTACVTAIKTGGCGIVEQPQNYPACAWLIPPATVVDASDAEAGEAAPTDADAAMTDADAEPDSPDSPFQL